MAAVLALAVGAPVGLARADPLETRSPPGDAERGRVLLDRYQCGHCHTIPGVPAARGRLAPSLERFGRRAYIAGHLPNRADLLARWIVAPHALVPGTAMPAMGVTPEGARDMAAYLGGLR